MFIPLLLAEVLSDISFSMNGFAYNSSVLGRELPGPQYIPWDNAAGESEFLEMITKRPDDPRTIDERRQEDMYVCTAYGNIAVAAMSGHGRATLPPLTYLHVFSEPLCDNTLQDGCYLVWHVSISSTYIPMRC